MRCRFGEERHLSGDTNIFLNFLMETPKSNKRRRGSASHSAAVKRRVHHQRAEAKPTKAAKRFEKKVLKVLKEPLATGKYTQTITQFLVQENYNKYSVFFQDVGNLAGGGLSDLEFFTPRMFKDAEAVIFNGKTASWNSWATVNEGATFNFPAQQTTKINGSSASFRFKNFAEHKMIVEMYICRGKGGGSHPLTDWNQCLLGSGKYVVNGPSETGGDLTRSLHVHMDGLPNFEKIWNVSKVVMKFEPGEEAFHNLQGPRGYCMKGSSKLVPNVVAQGNPGSTTPVFIGPSEPGGGVYVFFRVINNIGLVTSTTGSTIRGNHVSVCHPPNIYANGATNTLVGGVAVEITRHYSIEAPMGVTVPLMDVHIVNNNYGTPSGSTQDQEKDADQPHDNDDTKKS